MTKFIILLLFSIICSKNLFAQNPIKIIKAFQRNDIEFVNKNCTFPFEIFQEGNDTILYSNINQREKALNKCVEIISTKSIKLGKIMKETDIQYLLIINEISDSDNEVMESALIFYFRKIEGKYKLYKISLAG